MKFGIDAGHGASPDTGAEGNGLLEDNLTWELAQQVTTLLKALGHEVVDCRPKSATSVKHSLNQRCQIANSASVDTFVSIHFNASNGKGHGSEVFAISEKGKQCAKSVLSEIVKLGFFNRGVKEDKMHVLRETEMPSILVECCFIDNSEDMKRYDMNKMANAIVQGLVGQLPNSPQSLENSSKWQQFICTLKEATIECPSLKVAQLAQAILESGRGTSKLALEHNNFWGLKWRRELSEVATSVKYGAHDGLDEYCKFALLEDAIHGYWKFINRSPYDGWKKHATDPEKYLEFIIKAGYCPDNGYLSKVKSVLPEARKLLA